MTTDDTTREAAAARIQARGEKPTLAAVLKEQSSFKRKKHRVTVDVQESQASMVRSYDIFRRVGKLKT